MIIRRNPPRIIRAQRSSTPRLVYFVRDCLARSTWGCPQALLRFAIVEANNALLTRLTAKPAVLPVSQGGAA